MLESAVSQSHLTFSTRTRLSPYFEATGAAGVQAFTVYNKMLLPTVYKSAEEDYWPIINGVSMWDVAVERQVELKGPDALALVTLMTPRDLTKTKIGQCKYVPLCNEHGGIVNDPVLLRLADDHFWLSIADSDVLLWAMGLASGLGLDVECTEPDVSPMAIQGPLADDVAADLFGDWVRDLKFFWFKEFEFKGIPLVIARSGWSKQGGFELYLRDRAFGTELWERVADAGQPYGIQPGAPSSMERIEGGLLSYGNDMTIRNNPFEVGLDRYCALDQEADFLAKDALLEIRETGPVQRQIGITIEGEPIQGNDQWWHVVDADGQRVGTVTSACHSPRLQKNIALSIMDMAHQEPGMTVTVEFYNGERRGGTITALPFIS